MVAAEPLVQRYPGCRRRPAVELSTIQESYSVTKRDRACNSNIDFGPKSFYICSILAQRGRRPEAFLKVERGRRSRGCVRNAVSGGAETAIRALRPVCEELAARCPGGNARARKRGTVSGNRRWSAER